MRIEDIPNENRPREKALRYGIEKLSNQELLTLLIGSGVKGCSAYEISANLLNEHCNSLTSLFKSNVTSLTKVNGLKEAVALRLIACFEISKRCFAEQSPSSSNNLESIYKKFKYLENENHETLIILMLDKKLRIMKQKVLYVGTFDTFSIDVREVIQEVILANAKTFILIHNHPDGENKPSQEDILATKAIEKSASNLGLCLLDHIIIFEGGFYSFNSKTVFSK